MRNWTDQDYQLIPIGLTLSLDQKVITIRVVGSPAPQGSKRFMGLGGNGKGKLVESSKAVGPWREAVKAAAASDYPALLDGPLAVQMIFTVKKPASAPKFRRLWPTHAPDLSKLVRSTEDALAEAGVFTNDARIVHCVAAKVFPNEGSDAMPVPGCVIRVAEIVG